MTGSVRIALLSLVVLSLGGCGLQRFNPFTPRAEPQEPLPFEAQLTRSDADPRNFTVVVAAPGAGLETVRETARYSATSYCLLNYGSSTIDWTRDGVSGDWSVARAEGGRPLLTGRCNDR